ncbi:MAG: hypothetical protein ACHP82_02095 [Hyphomicrobiales bacterium]
MQTVTTIGLDIAKSVLQVHGIDAEDSLGRISQVSVDPMEQLGDPRLSLHDADAPLIYHDASTFFSARAWRQPCAGFRLGDDGR